MPATSGGELPPRVAAILDGVAKDLRLALGDRAINAAARAAKVDSPGLTEFLPRRLNDGSLEPTRRRRSIQLSTLLRVCEANGIPIEIRVGDPAAEVPRSGARTANRRRARS